MIASELHCTPSSLTLPLTAAFARAARLSLNSKRGVTSPTCHADKITLEYLPAYTRSTYRLQFIHHDSHVIYITQQRNVCTPHTRPSAACRVRLQCSRVMVDRNEMRMNRPVHTRGGLGWDRGWTPRKVGWCVNPVRRVSELSEPTRIPNPLLQSTLVGGLTKRVGASFSQTRLACEANRVDLS